MNKLIACVGLLALIGCRNEFDDPDYSAFQEVFDRIEEGDAEFVGGPDPFVPGDNRLAYAPFYDGTVGDDASGFLSPGVGGGAYFIFENSYSQSFSSERIQGASSAEIRLTGATGFWGGGVFFEGNPQDFREFQTLSIALRSEDASFNDVDITMADASGDAIVQASEYGYTNDGDWYQLFIPLQDFVDAGLDLRSVTNTLTLVNARNSAGDTLLVDNAYLDGDSVEVILADIEAATSSN